MLLLGRFPQVLVSREKSTVRRRRAHLGFGGARGAALGVTGRASAAPRTAPRGPRDPSRDGRLLGCREAPRTPCPGLPQGRCRGGRRSVGLRPGLGGGTPRPPTSDRRTRPADRTGREPPPAGFLPGACRPGSRTHQRRCACPPRGGAIRTGGPVLLQGVRPAGRSLARGQPSPFCAGPARLLRWERGPARTARRGPDPG